MSNIKTFGVIMALIATIFATAWVIISFQGSEAQGAAPSGLSATIATTSTQTVNTTASTVFATSTNCASRVISTASSSIKITFSDRIGETPNDTTGLTQGASTTKEYDAGLYGCGLVKVYSFGTQVITFFEAR